MTSKIDSLGLSELLAAGAGRYGIVGASAAVFAGEEFAEAATGLLNAGTGVEATSDALFQIGSISKVFTATLVLQLLEQGRVSLDDPVRAHLPDFSVASREASERLTVRNLLTHTGGFDGELFLDTGRDSDCIEKYVGACSRLRQVRPVGESPSYCNAGFVVLGAMLQRATGRSWDALLRERILEPLELSHATADYAELPRFRAAVGHVVDPETKRATVSKTLHLPRAMAPTGATLHASAGDLARFGRAFLDRGMCAPGARILEAATVAASLTPQAAWPAARWTGMRMGLGWQLHSWCGESVFGHDGATLGQAAYLRVMPGKNIVVALLTNGGRAKNLYHWLFNEIFRALAGIEIPASPAVPRELAFDAARVVGTYSDMLTRAEVLDDGGQLKLKVSVPQFAQVIRDETSDLVPLDSDACLIRNPELIAQEVLVFDLGVESGGARSASLNRRDLTREARSGETRRSSIWQAYRKRWRI